MAANLSGVVVFLLCVFSLTPTVSAGDDCESYTDSRGLYKFRDTCFGRQFCCGTCENRYCCSNSWDRLTEDAQDSCIIYSHNSSSTLTITSAVASVVILIILIISCCVCPCCCLYKMCRKPTPVIATTTTQVISTTYPQQPASGAQAYQGAQYPGYHPVPVQPGYGGQPTAPATYQGQPYQPGPQPGPPPPYQLAAGPGYPPGPGMSYSQAAFTPGQLAYSLQPPDQPGYPPQPQPGYPSQPQPGYPSQSEPQAPTQPAYNPAYNPAYAEPPPKMGY